MSDEGLGSLSERDVRQVALLVDSLGRSTFDYLQVEVGDLKLTIARGAPPPAESITATPNHSAAPVAASSPPTTPPRAAPAQPAASPLGAGTASAAATHGTVASGATVSIKAPIIGVFYAQPQPGAPPFVTVGTRVEADTTVALVEVMKTFNAVPAGVSGTIVEVCVENAQLVEFGQVLFRVNPQA